MVVIGDIISMVKRVILKLPIGNRLFWSLVRIKSLKGSVKRRKYLEYVLDINNSNENRRAETCKNNIDKILRVAAEKVVFYNNYSEVLHDLTNFPIQNKKLIRDNLKNLLNMDYSRSDLVTRNTGGSTGEPLLFVSDRRAGGKDNAHHFFLYGLLGWHRGDIVVGSGGIEITEEKRKAGIFWIKRFKSHVFGYYEFSTLYLNKENIRLYISQLANIKPAILRGYPSFYKELASYIIQNEIVFDFAIKGINLTAEYCSLSDKELIESAFNCKVILELGHSELGMFLYSTDGLTYTSCPTYGYIEVLDDNDRLVEIGQIGRIVVTSFINVAMPLIRYDTGDYARLKSFNHGYVKIDKLLGRSQDVLVDKCGRKIPLVGLIFGQHLNCFKNIQRWQITQSKFGLAQVKVVRDINYSELDEDEIKDVIGRSGDFEISFSYTDEILVSENGKFQFIRHEFKL